MSDWKKVKIGDFLTERTGRYKPDDKIISQYQRLDKIDFSGNIYISDKENKLVSVKGKLDGLNPLNVLSRGYAIAEKDEKIITSAKQLKEGEEFTVVFGDGKINARVCGE